MPPIYASTLHRRDRAWGARRRRVMRLRRQVRTLAMALLAAGAGALVERLIG